MTFKTAAKNFGNGLLTATTAIHNSSLQTQINELDEQIAELQERRNELADRKI